MKSPQWRSEPDTYRLRSPWAIELFSKNRLLRRRTSRNILLKPLNFIMPWVSIKTGLTAPDGQEEELREYLCDHRDCPNIATQILGCVVALHQVAAVCTEHAPKPQS